MGCQLKHLETTSICMFISPMPVHHSSNRCIRLVSELKQDKQIKLNNQRNYKQNPNHTKQTVNLHLYTATTPYERIQSSKQGVN